MSRVRMFLMWLMMLAVPFQGYAAASMALCGAQQPGAAVAMADHPGAHSAHAGMSDHTAHHHDAAPQAEPDTGTNTAHPHGDGVAKCSTCVACHAVALTDSIQVALLHALPQADLAEPASAMAKRATGVPDKPPRA
ncbi:hypothetical protein [Variovorax sp. GT1P44]|uniref:hypothetical protein n=1 Tax=Variovorax sp. GT1P44 TaxID=3443742 RepID=UPI003F46139C